MRVAVRVAGHVAAPPEAVWAWWTDYREEDHASEAFRPFRWGRRQILARDDEGRVTRFRDEGRALGYDTTYESRLTYFAPRAINEESTGRIGPFWAEYAFEPHRGGTRVAWTIRGEVIPLWARTYALLPGFVRAVAWLDLEGHLRDCRRDLAAAPSRGPAPAPATP